MQQAGHRRPGHDYAVILMLAAVAGAVGQVAGTIVEIGRVAGWW
jgi:hypothetical protein